VHIRRAAIPDAPQIARLSAQLGYPVSEEDTRSRLSALLLLPKSIVLVADTGSELTGWGSAELRNSLETGLRVEITGLVVDASARRLGIGRLLVQHLESWAADQNCSILVVRSNVARQESHPFYERLGYERTKTQHNYRKCGAGK
jgi:GNAT superfamily N-acetyltransferase